MIILIAFIVSLIFNVIQLIAYLEKREERKGLEEARRLRQRIDAECDRRGHARPA